MFCTFYGFRGGCGQTTTLAGVARSLALSGAQVTVMDLAPHPSPLSQQLGLGIPPFQGLLERVQQHMEGHGPLPSVVDLLQDVPLPRKSQGRLRFLSYGGASAGTLRRQEIPWATLYHKYEGYLFLEDLLAEIRSTVEPDLVLVDAGSGLGEGAAIAIRQIADVLVLFSRPNTFDLEVLEQGAAMLGRGRAPEERLLVLGPSPLLSPESQFTQRENAARMAGASQVAVVPWSPSLALSNTSTGPEEVTGSVYQNIATWNDGSSLSPAELKGRLTTLARRPFCLEKLLFRIKLPSSAVVSTFRTTLSRHSEPWAMTMAQHLALSSSPFVWRAAAAAALARCPHPFFIVTGSGDPPPPSTWSLPAEVAIHTVANLHTVRLPKEVLARKLLECLPAVDGERAAMITLDQVVAQVRLNEGVLSPTLMEVVERLIDLSYPRVTIRIFGILARMPRIPLIERLAQSFHRSGVGEGVKPAEFFQLLEPVGELAPTLVSRIVVQTWLENPGGAARYHGLALLTRLLELAPTTVAEELVQCGTRALSNCLFGEGRGDPEWLVVAYTNLPSAPGSELLGLVEDLLHRWSRVADPRLTLLITSLKPLGEDGLASAVIRWMLLGILPALPQGQSRPWWKLVATGFLFPPVGSERRWLATGREWGTHKGPNRVAAPPSHQKLLTHLMSLCQGDIQPTQLKHLWQCVEEGGDPPLELVCASVRRILSSSTCPSELLPPITKWLLQHPLDESKLEVALWLGYQQPRCPPLWESISQHVERNGAAGVLKALSRAPGVATSLPTPLVHLLLSVEVFPENLPGLLVLVAAGMVRQPTQMQEILSYTARAGISPGTPGPSLLAEAVGGVLIRPPKSGLEVCTQLLKSSSLLSATRWEVLLRLAGRLSGPSREAGSVRRLIITLLSTSHRQLRIHVTAALKSKVPPSDLSEDLLLELVGEVRRPNPSVDVLATALFFLDRETSFSPRRVAWAVQQIMSADSPAIVESDLVLMALNVLRRLENLALDEPTLGELVTQIRGQLEVRLPARDVSDNSPP